MPRYSDDEVLNEYACVAPYADIADKLAARYCGRVTKVEFSIPVANDADAGRLQAMIATLCQA